MRGGILGAVTFVRGRPIRTWLLGNCCVVLSNLIVRFFRPHLRTFLYFFRLLSNVVLPYLVYYFFGKRHGVYGLVFRRNGLPFF